MTKPPLPPSWTLDLELKTLHQDTAALFCKAVKTLATCVATGQAGFGATWTKLLVHSTFTHHVNLLLQHTGIKTVEELLLNFHKHTDPLGTAIDLGDLTINDKASVAPLIEKLHPIIQGLFTRPWDSL
jgi:hypothetical protein